MSKYRAKRLIIKIRMNQEERRALYYQLSIKAIRLNICSPRNGRVQNNYRQNLLHLLSELDFLFALAWQLFGRPQLHFQVGVALSVEREIARLFLKKRPIHIYNDAYSEGRKNKTDLWSTEGVLHSLFKLVHSLGEVFESLADGLHPLANIVGMLMSGRLRHNRLR